ncbi:MAG: enoyl-CoA hydratase/isomerase family protein [Candidatus Eisenbacteria bacterium]
MSFIKQSFEDGIATLTLANPPLNILTRAVLAEFSQVLGTLASAPELRALVIAAEGKHFSAGADVGEHLPPTHAELIPEFLRTIEALAAFPLPTVAAVRGRCLGAGFELAQACDMIVAGEGATFGQPEILLAVTAPAACVLLPRRTTRGHAAEILFGGEAIDVSRAFAIGVVQRVVPELRTEEHALALARRCARHSATALRATKRTLLETAEQPTAAAFQTAGRIYVDDLMRAADPVEGLEAFLARRTPVWRHR